MTEIVRSTSAARRGKAREEKTDGKAADRRHRPHDAEPFRPDLQDIGGEHGQDSHDAGEQHGDDVGRLADGQGATIVGDAQGARAIQGRHLQRRFGGQGAGVAADALGQQGGCLGFVQQVEVVVGCGPVGAERDDYLVWAS